MESKSKMVGQAAERYFTFALEQYAAMDKPTRLWVSPVEGRLAITASPRTDYGTTARLLVHRLHTSPVFDSLIDAMVLDESMAGSSAAAYAAGCWGRSPAQRSTEQAWALIDRYVTSPLAEYLDASDAHGSDSDEARRVIARLVGDLAARGIIVRRSVPLTRLRVSGGPHIIADGVVVRAAHAKDLEAWLNRSGVAEMAGLPAPGHVDVLLIHAVAEIVFEAPAVVDGGLVHGRETGAGEAAAQLLEGGGPATERLLTALRLATGGRIDAPFWREQLTGVGDVQLHTWERRVPLDSEGDVTLDVRGAEVASDIWLRLPGRSGKNPAAVAIRRLNYGATRESAEDRLIDYWIALESLFLPESQELSFRGSLRIAAYLGETPDERVEIYHRMRKSYDTRSKVVHGAVSDKIARTLAEVTRETGEILCRALVRVLRGPEFEADKIETALLRSGALGDGARHFPSAGTPNTRAVGDDD